MGFGLLIFGFTFFINYGVIICSEPLIGFDVFPDLLGYILMFIALKKLSPYADGFKNAKLMCYPLFIIGGAQIALPLIALLPSVSKALIFIVISYVTLAQDFLILLFSMLLFIGIRSLSLEVELPKIAKRAVAAFVICLLYSVPKIAISLVSFTQAQKSFIIIFYSLMFYAYVFFSIFLCFNCYMYICYEGEEDPEIKESKLSKFFDKLNSNK